MPIQARVRTVAHDTSVITTYEDIPDITYKFNVSQPGTASWSIPLSHPELIGKRDDFGPKRTDYRIGVSLDGGLNWQHVMSGFCGPVSLATDQSTVSVVGSDYLSWLDQPLKFSGYFVPVAAWPADVTQIIWYWLPGTPHRTIIEELIAYNNNFGDPTEQVQFQTSFTGNGWSDPSSVLGPSDIVLYMIGDGTTFLSAIQQFASLEEPNGFEFWIQEDENAFDPILVLWGPRRVTRNNSIAQYAFKPSLENIVSINWENAGPTAITTIGQPPAFPAFIGQSYFQESATMFRNWWQIRTFGETINSQALTDKATGSVGSHDRGPQKHVTLTFQPDVGALRGATQYAEQSTDIIAWFKNRLGTVIHIDSEDWFMPYHRINAYFWVIGQELTQSSASGDWLCTLTLEQIADPANPRVNNDDFGPWFNPIGELV